MLIWSLGQEDSLEKERATHSSILAWKIPWREDPGGLQSMRSQTVAHDWVTVHNTCIKILYFLLCITFYTLLNCYEVSISSLLLNFQELHLYSLLSIIYSISGYYYRIWAVKAIFEIYMHTQSLLTLFDPMDHSLPLLQAHRPWSFPNTGVGCHFLL